MEQGQEWQCSWCGTVNPADEPVCVECGEGTRARATRASRPTSGVILARKDTLLVWLVSILLILVVVNALMTLDLWLTLARFRDALSHVLQPGS